MLTAAVITISDRASAGVYEDVGGPLLATSLEGCGFDVKEKIVIPDEKERIVEELRKLRNTVHAVLTTGGTGFAPRDITPEATKMVLDREAPGITAALLFEGLKHTPLAALSRQTAGIMGKTVVVNLPGSPKAIKENMNVLAKILPHAAKLAQGESDSDGHAHARTHERKN